MTTVGRYLEKFDDLDVVESGTINDELYFIYRADIPEYLRQRKPTEQSPSLD